MIQRIEKVRTFASVLKAFDCFTKLKREKMKKLAFLFVAVAAISFASCGNGTKQAEVTEEPEVDTTTVVDSASQDSAAAEVVAEPVAEQQ